MLERPPKYKPRWPWVVAALVVVAALFLFNKYAPWQSWRGQTTAQKPPAADSSAPPAVASGVIDYSKIKNNSDENLEDLIKERKQDFGLDKSVDMVVGSEESIRVGDQTVPISEILEQIKAANGGDVAKDLPVLDPKSAAQTPTPAMVEEKLDADPSAPAAPISGPPPATSIKKSIDYYGVYVVRRGDNLWDIHFAFLREYLKPRGIDLSDRADEGPDGQSTGVSRILKWAESMVHIYNMKTRKLDTNLNLLEPEQKVVVFNLTQLHRILGAIKPSDLDQVRFDGTNLYLPTRPPAQ
jgi:hypothetical protein